MAKSKRKKLNDKLTETCTKIIRERDEWTCQHCGKPVEGSNAHVSHVIPKSRGNALRWDLLNLKLLCMHCHIHWWHKNPLEAHRWFQKKWPHRYSYLVNKSHDVWKSTIAELEELLEERKDKLNELLNE